ncbi:MAG: metallophosphatase domain-containing protein [Anaerolineaceae bacterium]|nr:metallophosphatase domain-containing protein [Anaerolineaceae bacterium]
MPQVRIICISDTHGQHAKLSVPDGDILIHAGDFAAFGDTPIEIIDFNQWLGTLPHRHKVVIAGNHDWMFERHPDVARELLTNAIYLENSGTELVGLKIWGSPVQPEFNNWAFNVARGSAIRRYWQMIPASTDVLITHGPPYGVLDTAHPTTDHLGCEELAEAVQQIRPRLHVFGHIHGGQGQLNSDETLYVNASVVNEAYQLVYAPQVVEIDISPEKE